MKIGNVNWTKNDMARVILQALFNTEKAFAADHWRVVRMAKRFNQVQLHHQLKLAFNALESRAVAK